MVHKVGASQILVLAANIAEKYMESIPNYEQKKKEQFFDAKTRYLNEINKEIMDRDDNLVSIYHDELYIILESFYQEIFKS